MIEKQMCQQLQKGCW